MIAVFITREEEVLVWKGLDISSEKERWKEVIEKIEVIFTEIRQIEVKLTAVVCDSASFYATTRYHLQLKYIDITFLLCYTHQMNLFVGEIFKESTEFCQAAVNAIKVVVYFYLVQYKYFISQLRDLQKEIYNKYISLAIGNNTC
ncbi:hypothetical protein F8M41_012089 [Gigaspora margarita]|uniref:DUF659 domain-containing protein n=1 Tax=Gigaspora margarita TaxID=4874 RepID=A0A8H4EPP9_GIGMA|nr:hypothetical protein F8M41_012089 [Gigaspora margarita]